MLKTLLLPTQIRADVIYTILQSDENMDSLLEEDSQEENPSSPFMTLEDVANIRKRHLGRELPTFSPYSGLEELISTFKGTWRVAAEECLERAKSLLYDNMIDIVNRVFEQFPEICSKVR